MPVALMADLPPVIPAMLAGFHHRLSAPVSATSPEKARPEALVDWS
jgi:hypothetical protein